MPIEQFDNKFWVSSIVIAAHTAKGKRRRRHNPSRELVGPHKHTYEPDPENEHILRFTTTVVARQFECVLEGSLDHSTGVLIVNVREQTAASYLKKLHYKVLGYHIESRITNVTRIGS